MKSILLGMLCAAALFGCGGSKPKPEAKATPTPERAVSQQKGMALPLGSDPSRVIGDLGEPAAVLDAKPFRCFVYKTDAGPDTWLRMCFRGRKMTGVGTIVGRKLAMTLDVPEAKGGGTLQKPKRSRKTVPVRTPTPTPQP